MEHSQSTFDTFILTILAVFFLFAVLFLITDGRVIEVLGEYAGDLGDFVSAIADFFT
ncbi:hypothetical protein KJ765_05410 [Candidatus Micrarchaeota archaeon]|nr:hypothetical protein [Candidatus Micrarchaeota archaeon]